MASSLTDKFLKVGAGTVTTLESPGKALAANSITVGATTNYPTDTGIIVAIRVVDSSGELIAGTYTEWKATVSSGTTLVLDPTPVYGNDQVYAAGSTTQVFIPTSAYAQNTLIDGILVAHNQDGTLKDNIVDSTKVSADLRSGWILADETWAYASATTITVPAGAASIYSVGDKIRFQNNDSGTYLYAYVITVANTLLTVVGNAVPNATLTDNYYSKVGSPVGFPQWFAWTPTLTVSAGTAPDYAVEFVNRYNIQGRKVSCQLIWHNNSGGTAGNGTAALKLTLPVAASSTVYTDFNHYQNVMGMGVLSENGGTVTGISVSLASVTLGSFVNIASLVAISGNDQSDANRWVGATFTYEI